MEDVGQIQQTSWLESTQKWFLFWSQPKTQCEVYASCGAFGSCNEKSQPFCNCLRGFNPKKTEDWGWGVFSGGCERASNLQCGNSSVVNGKNDRFFSSNNLGLPSNSQTVEARGAQECESACLSSCNCTAYAYDGSLCKVWFGDLLDMKQLGDDSNENTIYIRLAASEFSSSKNDDGDSYRWSCGLSGDSVSLWPCHVCILEEKNSQNGESSRGFTDSFWQSEDGKVKFFPSLAAKQINQEDGEILSLLDHRLDRNADLEELTRICKVACWCIQDDEAHRPSMGLVVQILEGVVNVNPPPIPRSLQVFVENQESIIFFTESSSSQSSQAQSHTSSQTKNTTSNSGSNS
ncbi:hypothetical protein OIU85_004165 [Salix viminalis]|uniref:Apple domain-containing protein n=1 Tax=Salix viminalis TaxID=40686 RepID=A0A9Q0PS08_SALVM|nr:hypothetical protein OIU85_004165 [Salix viminalis]